MYKKYDLKTLEKEYSPSSCVEDINVYINQYIEFSEKAKDIANANSSMISDLKYGTNPDEKLDLYLPTTGNKKKLQIYIHGGYWQALSKEESSFAATNFQEHGCYFAALDYSLAPNASLTEIVAQVREAIAFLFRSAANFGYDADEIYLSGSSAGAHLAMMMLQTQWSTISSNLPLNLVKGVCAVSGIYELSPIQQTYINEPLQLSVEEVEQLSPIRHKNINDSPVILAFGDNETEEFRIQTEAMQARLVSQSIETQCKKIHERNHFNVILDLSVPKSWLFLKVAEQMKI